MTFHAFLPNPHTISTPYIETATTYDIELVAALDVSNYKTAALYLRVHSTLSGNTTLRLIAFPVWPYEDAINSRFQGGTPVAQTALMDASTIVGSLLTDTPGTVCAPALRIVARIGQAGGDAVPDIVTISGGISLLAD